MAPTTSNEEQFKFLISCIRYSNNGKVDFGQVALECQIVSKGAAAKRYERLMKAHGINSNTRSSALTSFRPFKVERRNSTNPLPNSATSMSRQGATMSRQVSEAQATKRKHDAFTNDSNNLVDDDDEEDFGVEDTPLRAAANVNKIKIEGGMERGMGENEDRTSQGDSHGASEGMMEKNIAMARFLNEGSRSLHGSEVGYGGTSYMPYTGDDHGFRNYWSPYPPLRDGEYSKRQRECQEPFLAKHGGNWVGSKLGGMGMGIGTLAEGQQRGNTDSPVVVE